MSDHECKVCPECDGYRKRLDFNEQKLEKLESHIASLSEQLHFLQSKVFWNKSVTTESQDTSTQTDHQSYVDQVPVDKADSLTVGDVWDSGVDTNTSSGETIADMVKSVAEQTVHNSGFVFEETSGLYYDYNTGYYYDAERGLYYDGNSGIYYTFNAETQQYEFHSQLDLGTTMTTEPPASEVKAQEITVKKIRKPRKSKEKVSKENPDLVEDGECSSSSLSSYPDSTNDSCYDAASPLSEPRSPQSPHDPTSYPPCVRIIVWQSDLKNVPVGSLFMITCAGGVIGREAKHDVCIPDESVSKYHARISYVEADSKYTIQDFGSRNGTILNGNRMSASLQESEDMPLVHGSMITLGSGKVKLLCHIHKGRDTCGQCEPGLVQRNAVTAEKAVSNAVEGTVVESSADRKQKHKEEMIRIRSKFGLQRDSVGSQLMEIEKNEKGKYKNRANERRKKGGTDNSNAKTQQASVNQSISTSNLGFKMLSKMGWQEGEGLGKTKAGIVEPVSVEQRSLRAGLGSDGPIHVNVDPSDTRKREIWEKTQQRFSTITPAEGNQTTAEIEMDSSFYPEK